MIHQSQVNFFFGYVVRSLLEVISKQIQRIAINVTSGSLDHSSVTGHEALFSFGCQKFFWLSFVVFNMGVI